MMLSPPPAVGRGGVARSASASVLSTVSCPGGRCQGVLGRDGVARSASASVPRPRVLGPRQLTQLACGKTRGDLAPSCARMSGAVPGPSGSFPHTTRDRFPQACSQKGSGTMFAMLGTVRRRHLPGSYPMLCEEAP